MISIIIVTWNSAGHIARCLASLPAGVEIIVVDNASSDDTAAEVRRFSPANPGSPGSQVNLIAAKENLGFAGACNLGARHSSGDVLLFLNPDTQLRSPLDPIAQALDKRSTGSTHVAVGAMLVDAEGRPQTGFLVRRFPTLVTLLCEILLINRLFPNNSINRTYRCLNMDPALRADVEQPAGAALAVRRDAFEAIGGFDERYYPLWFEDVDLCLRLRKSGGAIGYLPEVVFAHHGGHSLDSLDFSNKQVYWYRNMLYYVVKNLGWRYSLVVRFALVLGLGLRAVAELAGLATGPIIEWCSSRPRTQSRVRNARAAAYWRALRVAFASSPGRRLP